MDYNSKKQREERIKITVKFPPYMRALTKTDQTTFDLDENARVSDLLKVLTEQYGGRFTDLLNGTSELSWGIWASIITDGQDVLIDGIAKSEVKLKEGSVVVLLGPVGGG